MPIYEYRCRDCGARNSYIILSQSSQTAVVCKRCSSSKLDRLMSRFSAPKSEEARMEALADPSNFGDVDENDPQSMARFMKKMGQEMGEDLGEDFDAAMEESGGGMGESDVNGLD
jgi:putative FmdB family regulatory protein